MLECFHCGEQAVSWDSDFDAEECGYDCKGIMHELHCNNCGCEITYVLLEEE